MEKRIITKMVKAMNLKETDVVLINFWGNEEEIVDLTAFEEVFDEFGIAHHALRFADEDIINLVEENPDGLPEGWLASVEDTTVVIDMIEKPIGMPPEGLAREKYPVFGGILHSLFDFMSQHEKLIQITMPSKVNAKMVNMPFEQYEARVIRALDIDYDELKTACEEKIESFSGNRRVIKTGTDCELTMDTTGRKWYVDAGDGALPCGEIYIAPVEHQTNGTIFFENFAVEGVGAYPNVTLTIKDGKLVSSDCEEFNEFMSGIEEEGADIVAELGIGMNPNVVGNEGDSTIDENALGTFHIALGMNYMFGGENTCHFHMDFVTKGKIN